MKAITLTNVVKNIFFLAVSLASLSTFAQEDKKFNFSGSADVYWKTNLTGTNEADGDGMFNTPPTSFANRSGFALGMANLIASYEGEKVGFVADLVFGPRGEDAVFLSTGSANIVNQLYVYWILVHANVELYCHIGGWDESYRYMSYYKAILLILDFL